MKRVIAVIVLGVFGVAGIASMVYAASPFDSFAKTLGRSIGEKIVREMAKEQFENLLRNDPEMTALYEAYRQGYEGACREADERYGHGACKQMRQRILGR